MKRFIYGFFVVVAIACSKPPNPSSVTSDLSPRKAQPPKLAQEGHGGDILAAEFIATLYAAVSSQKSKTTVGPPAAELNETEIASLTRILESVPVHSANRVIDEPPPPPNLSPRERSQLQIGVVTKDKSGNDVILLDRERFLPLVKPASSYSDKETASALPRAVMHFALEMIGRSDDNFLLTDRMVLPANVFFSRGFRPAYSFLDVGFRIWRELSREDSILSALFDQLNFDRDKFRELINDVPIQATNELLFDSETGFEVDAIAKPGPRGWQLFYNLPRVTESRKASQRGFVYMAGHEFFRAMEVKRFDNNYIVSRELPAREWADSDGNLLPEARSFSIVCLDENNQNTYSIPLEQNQVKREVRKNNKPFIERYDSQEPQGLLRLSKIENGKKLDCVDITENSLPPDFWMRELNVNKRSALAERRKINLCGFRHETKLSGSLSRERVNYHNPTAGGAAVYPGPEVISKLSEDNLVCEKSYPGTHLHPKNEGLKTTMSDSSMSDSSKKSRQWTYFDHIQSTIVYRDVLLVLSGAPYTFGVNSIHVWEIKSGEESVRLTGNFSWGRIYSMALSPDHNQIAISMFWYPDRYVIRVFDTVSGGEISNLPLPVAAKGEQLLFSDDGEQLISYRPDLSVGRVFDAFTWGQREDFGLFRNPSLSMFGTLPVSSAVKQSEAFLSKFGHWETFMELEIP
jgi:hypothetical protein